MPARVALGIRPDFAGSYVFAPVVGEVDDGRLLAATPSRFPPRGTIHVHESLFPEPFEVDCLGFWDCEERLAFQEDHRGSMFTAVRRRSDLPAEIVKLGYRSTEPTAVRDRLLKTGLTSTFPLDGRDVLLQFIDGVIAGPIHLKRFDASDRYLCENAAPLDRPLPSWNSRADLHAVELRIGNALRSFVWPILQHDGYVHLGPPEQMLRTLLRIGSHRGPGTYLITEAQRNEIAQRLADIDDPKRVIPLYRERLQNLLDESLKTGKVLDVWFNLLREHPDIQRQLDQHKEKVAAEARNEIVTKESALLQSVADLQAKERSLTENLKTLRERCADEQARKDQVGAGMAEAIIARVREAKEDVPKLLAEVSLLQPFLAQTTTQPGDPSRGPLSIERHKLEARRLESLDDALRHLTLNLVRLGLQTLTARNFAREIMAALTLKQALFFRGSFARQLSRTVVFSLTAANWHNTEIPLGLSDHLPMQELLSAAIDPTKQWSGLLIDGLNRSPIDAYAPMLIEVLSDRQVGQNDLAPRLVIVGSLVEGTSALPPDEYTTALGPIWHTDYLRWNTPTDTQAQDPGQLGTWGWPHPDGPDRDLEELLETLSPVPSELWRRSVMSAYRRLTGWPSKEAVTPSIESVLFGWVLPRCIGSGVDLTAHADRIRQEFSDPKKIDARLKRLLRTAGLESVL
jgi:hypothetical protein